MAKECLRCHGTGSIECPLCDGKGYKELYTKVPVLSILIDTFRDTSGDTRPCSKCDETGEIKCPNCMGSGTL